MSAPPPPVHQPTSPGPKPLPPNPFDLVSVPERYQIKNQSSFEWVITNWSQFKTAEKRYSDEFVMGDSRWRLMVFPNGNRTPDWLSVFLECLDFVEPTTPVNETVDGSSANTINIDESAVQDQPEKSKNKAICLYFVIAAQNVKNENISQATNPAHHRFSSKDADWGFSQAVSHAMLKKPAPSPSWNPLPSSPTKSTSLGDIMENESFKLKLFCKEVVDETGTLWMNFQNWDSKKETGCVGLLNQGATCYLNSLLQSLYFTNYFRKATYAIPTDNDEPTESVAYALQRLFYHMQFDNEACGTQELTRSFGWNTAEAFHQHDVQELNRVLQDKLENSMKGTPAEGAIRKLFTGKMKSYIKCTNVDFESSRIEDFYDIQLNVKNCKNLKESFIDYCNVETLEGENAYYAQGFGLQTAKKGVIFNSFPPVLHLQLKRFDYDMENDRFVKINDRHEFDFELDLDEFIEDDGSGAPKVKQHYKLQAVLVHSGDLNAGHYYVIARPTLDSKWYRFDDDRVTPVSKMEILDDNFGGEIPAQTQVPKIKMGSKYFTNAYMLVYIRESDEREILAPIEPQDIPSHLVDRVQMDLEVEQKRQEELRDRHLYIPVLTILDRDLLSTSMGLDFGFPVDKSIPTENANVIREQKVRRTATVEELRAAIAQDLNLTPSQVRLWTVVQRQNKTCRIDDVIEINRSKFETNSALEELQSLAYKGAIDIRIFIETSQQVIALDNNKPVYFSPRITGQGKTVSFMVKHYDPTVMALKYLGIMTAKASDKFSSLLPIFSQYLNQPPQKIAIFEEIRPDMIDRVVTEKTFDDGEILNGDILCFQIDFDANQVAALPEPAFAFAPTYYEFLSNKVEIEFVPEFPEQVGGLKGVSLMLSKIMTLDKVLMKLGQHLEHDPSKIKLSMPSGNTKVPIKSNDPVTLGEILGYYMYSKQNGAARIIYFELLDISLTELESKRALNLTVLDTTFKETGPLEFLVSKLAKMTDLCELVKQKMNLQSAEFRIFEVLNSRKVKTFLPTDTVSILNEYATLYFQIIPKSEQEILSGEKEGFVVEGFHFAKDTYRGHGIPFTIEVFKGDTCNVLKDRISTKLSMPKKDMEKAKLAVVTKSYTHVKYYSEDEEVLFSSEEPFCIGLDHIDKSRGRPAATGGIKIN